jgi:ribosomal protein S10
MIDAFPELKALFKLKSFDQKALDECIEIINKIYPQKDKNKMAHALLKMELMKYSMHKVPNEESVKPKKNNFQKRSFEKIENIQSSSNWKKLIGKKLDVISKRLDVRPEFIIRLLSQKGIQITIKQSLTFDELSPISEYIENRIHILERQKENKKYNRVSKTNKSTLSVFKGAWGAMRKYGTPGKIIYIRSK